MRMEPESRVMRRLNGEQLKVIAGDGTIFKGAAQREITRRDRKSDKKVISGVGAGEGLAAVRGYQSGAEGARVAMPAFSREIETV